MNRRSMKCAAVAALLAAGCGGGESAGDAAASFCSGALAAVFQKEAVCRAWSPASLERALAGLTTGCAGYRGPVDAGRQSFDPVRAATCLQNLGRADSSCPFTMPPTCAGVLTPQVPAGGACTYGGDCAAGWCVFTPGTCPATGMGPCVSTDANGDTCLPMTPIFSSPPCGDGEECGWDGSRLACITPPPPPGAGDPCGGSGCGPGLYCQASADGPIGLSVVCEPDVGLGAPCPIGVECSPELTCGAQHVCARFVGQGASCADPTTACGDGLFCDEGTCAPLPGLDASCAKAGRCFEGYCSTADELCHALEAGGEECSAWNECASSVCDGGICTATCGGS
jgi:hypothetical protein